MEHCRKTALLIGRDTRREDVDSTNGIRVQKPDNRIYEVSKTQPCQVEKGDILSIGLTRLAAE